MTELSLGSGQKNLDLRKEGGVGVVVVKKSSRRLPIGKTACPHFEKTRVCSLKTGILGIFVGLLSLQRLVIEHVCM